MFTLGVHDDGSGPSVYVGGFFEHVGTQSIETVGKWSGTAWEPVAGSSTVMPTGGIQAFEVADFGDGPLLYAAGGFIQENGSGINGIGRWDGTQWTLIATTGRRFFPVTLRAFDDGTGLALYAGGGFSAINDSAVNYLAKWDGTSWTGVGGGVSGGALTPVQALEVFDDGTGPALYVGGWYVSAGGITCNSIAKWDGQSWSALGSGLGGYPFSCDTMTVFDDGGGPALFVGGTFFSAGGIPAGCIAKWDGHSWSALGSGMNTTVTSLAVFDDGSGSGAALFAGGYFTAAGGIPAKRVAKWDGQEWHSIGSTLSAQVNDMTVFDDGSGEGLFIGGHFSIAAGAPADRIIQYRSCINGDFDLDRDVDLVDFRDFALCYNGANRAPAESCDPFVDADFDGDGDVDLGDYATFAQNFTGAR